MNIDIPALAKKAGFRVSFNEPRIVQVPQANGSWTGINHELSRFAVLVADAARAELLETLQGIANADWRTWPEASSPSAFVKWAQSRARHAIANTKKGPQ